MGDWFGGGVREWVGATELYRVQADPLACAKRSAEDSVAAALGRLLLSLPAFHTEGDTPARLGQLESADAAQLPGRLYQCWSLELMPSHFTGHGARGLPSTSWRAVWCRSSRRRNADSHHYILSALGDTWISHGMREKIRA